MEKIKLTKKEEEFCQAYLIDFNGGKAARQAGYSKASCYVIATELLRKPNIQARIQQLRDETGRGFNITRERIAQELARISFFDIRKIHNENGGLKPIQELSDDEAAAIGGVETFEEFENFGFAKEKTGDLRKIKIWDKVKAIESLTKMMGYNEPDKLSLSGTEIKLHIVRTGNISEDNKSASTAGESIE